MMFDNDYRFSVNASLQIMRESRQRLVDDTLNKNNIIYQGLHDMDTSRQKLYFQYYITEWLLKHWNDLQDILNRHKEYTVDQKKQIVLFFAEKYGDMIDRCQNSGVMAKLAIPKMLEEQKGALREMLSYSDRWEAKSNELRLMIKKNKEQFEHLLKNKEDY